MDINPYLLKEFEPFTPQTKMAEVQSFFKQTRFSHFPVVANKKLLGLIAETETQGLENEKQMLGELLYLFNLFFAEENNNLLEIIKVFAANETNIIPVINSQKEYLGYYDLTDVLHLYNSTPFLNNEGIVLILEKELKNYSFSEVCQIVESNNGKIGGLFILETTPSTLKIIVKFSATDSNEIIQSFRRYNYTVLSKLKEDLYLEDLKDRSNYLQKYLNI